MHFLLFEEGATIRPFSLCGVRNCWRSEDISGGSGIGDVQKTTFAICYYLPPPCYLGCFCVCIAMDSLRDPSNPTAQLLLSSLSITMSMSPQDWTSFVSASERLVSEFPKGYFQFFENLSHLSQIRSSSYYTGYSRFCGRSTVLYRSKHFMTLL